MLAGGQTELGGKPRIAGNDIGGLAVILLVSGLSARQIRAIHTRTRMSQAVFATVLNISTSTVQKWEIGAKRPSGPSLKLLNVIHAKGIDVLS